MISDFHYTNIMAGRIHDKDIITQKKKNISINISIRTFFNAGLRNSILFSKVEVVTEPLLLPERQHAI